MGEEEVDVGTEIEVDESICIICGGSTYVGETISCETCLRWFHFQCVGVTHNDDCVRMEDVPYFCPTCHLKTKKPRPIKKPKKPRKEKLPPQPKVAAPKTPKTPKNRAKPAKSITAPSSSGTAATTSPGLISPTLDGIKLKISFKSPTGNDAKENPIKDKMSKTPYELDQPPTFFGLSPLPVSITDPQLSSSESSPSSPEVDNVLELVIDEKEEMGSRKTSSSSKGKVEVEEKGKRKRNESEEEEKWLDAVEAGTLDQVDEELRSVKEPRLMTARQRAMLDRADGCDTPPEEDGHISLDYGFKKKDMTPSNLIEKALKAQKRKEIESEKKEKMKKKTMDFLLKKKDSKAAKQMKSSKLSRDSFPKITYVINANGHSLSYPENSNYDLVPKVKVFAPPPVHCVIDGCKNVKKYSCSKTGKPLCSLNCYKLNMQTLLPPV